MSSELKKKRGKKKKEEEKKGAPCAGGQVTLQSHRIIPKGIEKAGMKNKFFFLLWSSQYY